MKINTYVVGVVALFAALAFFEFQFSKLSYDDYATNHQKIPFINNNYLADDIDGFEKAECEHFNTQFLKPSDWYFLEESNDQSTACFISVEEISAESDYFQTGLSINSIQNASEKLPIPSSEALTVLLDETQDNFQQVEEYQIRNQANPDFLREARIMSSEQHTVYYANYLNQQTDTLYLISFESPTQEWESAWKQGQQIVETIRFDPNY